MTNVPTWISRVSAVALATASVTAFAAAPNQPEFLMHKASVNLKVSKLVDGKIKTTTVKTNDVINAILNESADNKPANNEKLGMVTECASTSNAGVALVVYDKDDNSVISSPERAIVFDFEAAVTELDKNGDNKKTDLLVESEDDGGFEYLAASGKVKYGKIGKKVADDTWDKDSVCAKNFSSKSVNGRGLFFDEVVMSGKVSAGKAQFASDGNIFPSVSLAVSKAVSSVDNGFDYVTAAGDDVDYDIVVTNAGVQQVTGLTVTDANSPGVTCDTSILNVGASANCTATMTVTAEQIDTACGPTIGGSTGTIENIAVATVAESVSSFATNAFVSVDCANEGSGAIAISKSSFPDVASDGSTVDYFINISNQTGEPLTGVTVSDTGVDILDCGNETGDIGDLAIGEQASCQGVKVVTQADIDLACATGGHIRNIATVTSNETETFGADDLVGVACPK